MVRFSLGLTPYTRYPDLPSLQAVVRLAERLGFHGVSIGDHVVIPQADAKVISPFWYDPFVLGAAIAATAPKLRLVFNTLIAPYHHPLALAKALSSLDVLSGGRVTAGIGVGWMEREFEALGVPFKERGARTDECVRAMKAAWTEERPSFQGRFFSFRDIAFQPRPLQQPHPPIWIGGGVRRTLERAAELGDGWHPLGRSWEQLTREVEELREMLVRRGRDPSRFALSYTLYYASVAGQTSRHARSAGAGEATVLAAGTGEALEQLAAYDRLGFTHLTIRLRGLTQPDLCAAMERFSADIMAPASGMQSSS